tara:strand:+ start:66 stop:593 length:528 start_codon:yes stop_codon:yes gene_type:complete
MGIPYFLSAQLDGHQRNPKTDSGALEGWIGFLFFNLAAWVAIIIIDIMLLANEFKHTDTPHHKLQTGALVSVIVSAGTIVAFYVGGMCFGEPFTSNPSKEAATLPPFATALIAGGLKATLGFSYVLLIVSVATATERQLQYLIAVIALKHFGSAMAMANQRLHLFTTESVVSATY